ncbi:MAG: MFS transporter [Allobranchiibius sp.]
MTTPPRAAEGSAANPPNPLRSHDFRWFFIARAVSVLGSSMTPVALAFAVLQMTGRAADLSYVLTASMVPMISLTIFGGGIADRFRRDALLRWTSLLSGVSQAGVAFCVITDQPIRYLVALAFINGATQAFAGPAMSGIIPQLVAREGLQKANSQLASARNAARVLGPTAAGMLVATVGGGIAILIDAASFLIAAWCMLFVALPDRPAAPARGLAHELREGWTYFRSTSWIWSVTAAFTVVNAVQTGVWQILGPVIATHTFGADGWGAVLSVRAVGLLVMSVVMLRWTVRRPLVFGLMLQALGALPLLLLGLGVGVAVLAVGALLAGLGTSFMGVTWDTARHTHIPPQMMSRVSSYDDFGSYAAIPVGQLAVIPLAAIFGAEHVAIYGAALFASAVLLPLSVPGVRNLAAAASP